jgi:hypothetical protein
MSAAESDVAAVAGNKRKAAAAAASAAAAAADGPADLVESVNDDHETHMIYNEGSRVPWWVIVVWAIALTGFGIYLARYLFPDLALWGAP